MKRLKYILIILLAVFVAPFAQALIQGEADNTVNVNKDYEDNTLFAGNIVNVDSKIDGLGFVAGNTLTIKGSADYGFIAGNIITIANYETKDLFVAGNEITISNIKARSIYASANKIKVTSDVSTVYLSGDEIVLEGDFKDVYVACNKFKLNGKITGTLKINDDASREVDEKNIANIEAYKSKSINKDNIAQYRTNIIVGLLMVKVVAKLLHALSILIIGFIFIALFKKTVKKIENMGTNPGFIFARFGIGLVGLIIIPIISIILLITVIGLPLGVIGLTLYCLALYLSEVIGTLYIGKLIFKKMNNFLRYFLTLLILSIITLIPILGGLVSFFMLCLSLGIIGNIILSEIKGK